MIETKGVLLTCSDEAIYMFLKKLDRERKFILDEIVLDRTHLFVDASAVSFVQERMEELMDEISFDRIAVDTKK